MINKIVNCLLKFFFEKEEIKERLININIKNVLIIRQHNQFGDMLASVSLFRAIKEYNLDIKLSVVASPQNYYAITSNKYIDNLFVFNKSKLFNPFYFISFVKYLRNNYDLVIVPATVSISFTSNLLARISKTKVRIGPNSLDGKINKSAYFFDRRIDLDWRTNPDSHVSDFSLDIIRPFGIFTNNFRSHICWTDEEEKYSNEIINSFRQNTNQLIFGFHIGAGKPQNRWNLDNFINLIEKLKEKYNFEIIVTGSKSDKNEIDYFKNRIKYDVNFILDKTIPQLAAIIDKCNIFVTNDTGVMHVAGVTKVDQVSLFGPTNPYNWAPIGDNKIFLKKSVIISEISVDDVYNTIEKLLKKEI